MSQGLIPLMFCNCRYNVCDCGCVEECRISRHRAALSPAAPEEAQ